MMGMSVSWSVLGVATQVHGIIQAADGPFSCTKGEYFLKGLSHVPPNPHSLLSLLFPPFFFFFLIFQIALKALETVPAELAHYPWDAEEGCCHGTAASPSFAAVPGGRHRSLPGQGLWIPHQGRPFWGPWGFHQGFQQPVPPGASHRSFVTR